MTPEQREKLKRAAQKVAPDCLGVSFQYRQFAAWATPANILSLIAQVEAYQSDAELNAACTSAFQGESLDEKALNALLWFYRRAEHAYGRLPFAEEAITGLRARIVAAPTIPAIPGTTEAES